MKNTKYINMLNSLSTLYKFLLPSKDIFDKKIFKYSKEDIDEMINYFCSNEIIDTKKDAKKSNKKTALPLISTKEDAEKYCIENMMYHRSDLKQREKIIKKHYLDDLKLIYNLLYNTKPQSSKELNFDAIQRYFENINRSLSL